MTKLFKRITSLAMATVMAASATAVTSVTASAKNDVKEYDFTVWANGKNIKSKTDGTTFYKTAEKEVTGMYSGGKWTVMVTDSTIEDVSDFLALFNSSEVDKKTVYSSKLNDKGKTMQKSAKELATAKLKEGKITVTAGKKAGAFNVWLYEVKAKNIVNDSDNDVVPTVYSGVTKMAASSINLTATADNSLKKVTEKPTLEVTAGDTIKFYICDKKADVTDASFKVLIDGKEATEDQYKNGLISVETTAAGKVKITVTCVESSKKANFTVKVKAKAETTTTTKSK